VKSLVDLVEALLLECGREVGAQTSRDVKTLRARVENEGDGFLTITLPAFCSDFERSLAEGGVAPGCFNSFKKLKTGIPAFLQGFLCRVFDKDGSLLADPDIRCIRFVRQITLFCKRIERPCDLHRKSAALKQFRKCESEVVTHPVAPSQLWRYFGIVADTICARLDLDNVDEEVDIVPTHGPGATEEGASGNQKWVFRRWHARLEEVGFTFLKFGLAHFVGEDRADDDVWPDLIEPEDERPVKVVFVPKTMKTPRVIAVEPVCMQYAQQAFSRLLRVRLNRCALTRGHVNFRDQSVNQHAASFGSRHGLTATLDLSEASDRVSLAHVERLFKICPDFLECILACRSMRARLPDGSIIPLKKFASMGSALCFPVESLVFYTAILAIRASIQGRFPSARLLRSLAKDVFVYGDDLIVPAHEASAICDGLETLGFKVNQRKSFWTGKFRESCGEDYYDGEQVTPVYLRRDIPANRRDASGLVSSVSTANQLQKAGYVETARLVKQAVHAQLGTLPELPETHPALGWWQSSDLPPNSRWNKDLQRGEIRAWVPTTTRRADSLNGWSAYAKCYRLIGRGVPSTMMEQFDPVDPDHLETSVRPYSLNLKRRWVPRA
jgi:hypothetical protein